MSSRPSAPLAPSAPSAEAARWHEQCWRALSSRDARFDGRFFTGVTSTGVYCRPVCAVRTPRRENCQFYATAAHAEQAGFRPCLRCRPELAPAAQWWSATDAASVLVREALRRLQPQVRGTEDGAVVQVLARRLGVTDRHLRRVFQQQLGVTPQQVWQTRRLLAAKQLLTDTTLPVHEVASASGFGSARRLQAAFATHYGLEPTALRRQSQRADDALKPALRPVRLGYRPPLDADALLAFGAQRQLPGLEQVDTAERTMRRVVRAHGPQGRCAPGWIEAVFDPLHPVVCVRLSDSLLPELPAWLARVRHWLDLDADPAAIHAVLGRDFPAAEGLRVPGTTDGFELAVRAVLGQQVSVAAARTLAGRVLDAWGEPVSTPWPALHRAFPSAAVLARVPAEALGALGIVRQRQQALLALAQQVDAGLLDLSPEADVEATRARLCSLPGIGAWTADYIALRALRWPDAFPAADVALHQALGIARGSGAARAATARAEPWRPWRGYALLRAWAGHYQPPGTPGALADGDATPPAADTAATAAPDLL
ncbi:DNA-3-methyladenine glycosylase 2 family protein [Acidovorax lacteus]